MAPPQRVPVDQPAPQPRRPGQPGPKVWGDKEAEDAGLYPSSQPAAFNDRFAGLNPQAQPGAMQPTPVQTERIGNPAIAQPSGVPQRSSVSIPPDVAGSLRTMIANPRTRGAGPCPLLAVRKASGSIRAGAGCARQCCRPAFAAYGRNQNRSARPGVRSDRAGDARKSAAYGFKGPNDPALHEAMQKRLVRHDH